MTKYTMYELNKKIAESIDQIDGAEVTNKGQYNQGKPQCDIDFTYDKLASMAFNSRLRKIWKIVIRNRI